MPIVDEQHIFGNTTLNTKQQNAFSLSMASGARERNAKPESFINDQWSEGNPYTMTKEETKQLIANDKNLKTLSKTDLYGLGDVINKSNHPENLRLPNIEEFQSKTNSAAK